MTPLELLWLPILVAAVAVFVVSSVLHMALPIHKNDYARLPAEAQVLDALRTAGVRPGQFMFPACPGSMKEMASPEMVEKYRQGPVGSMIVLQNGPPSMGRALGLWFAYCVVVCVIVGYLAGLVLAPGADRMLVFRLCGTAAVLGFSLSHVVDSIWKGLAWSISLKYVFDGVLYALTAGAVFAWLWPGAA